MEILMIFIVLLLLFLYFKYIIPLVQLLNKFDISANIGHSDETEEL